MPDRYAPLFLYFINIMASDTIHFDEILSRYRSDPYDYVDMHAVHAGEIRFLVENEAEVKGVSGEWKHIPGSSLYEITRERNPKVITSKTNGTVSYINTAADGQFVESGTKLMTVRHPLKKKEIIESILQEVLYLFVAPERARYFFSLDIQSRIDQKIDRRTMRISRKILSKNDDQRRSLLTGFHQSYISIL